jgi:hypothetical protein
MPRRPSVRIRRNLPVDQGSKSAKHAKDWHWGVEAKQRIDWTDPDIDRNLHGDLIEIGRLVELKIRLIGQRKLSTLAIPPGDVDHCHVAFDRGHKHQRIYLLIVPGICKVLSKGFDPEAAIDLRVYAQEIGGRHGTRDYPAIKVTPLGRCLDTVYKTEKGSYEEGDEPDNLSTYIHRNGEDGGIPPGIAVDSYGRLWFAGGSYIVVRPGITS